MAAICRRVAGRSTGMFLSRRRELRFSKYAESTTTPGRRARPRENRICEHVADRAARHAPGVPGLDSGAPNRAGTVSVAVVRRRARRVLQAGSAAGSENRNAAGAAAHDRRNEAAEPPARGRLPQFRVMRGALRGGGGGKSAWGAFRATAKGVSKERQFSLPDRPQPGERRSRARQPAARRTLRARMGRFATPCGPPHPRRRGKASPPPAPDPARFALPGARPCPTPGQRTRRRERGAIARRESSRRPRHRDRDRPPGRERSPRHRPRSWRSAATGGPSRTRSRRARGPLPP